MIKICPVCNKLFRGRKKRCSKACFYESLKTRKPKPCVICGLLFLRKHNSTNTCSKVCKNIYLKRVFQSVNTLCAMCGKTMSRQKNDIKKGVGLFCSKKCYGATKIKQKLKKDCLICGNAFLIVPSRFKTAKFCSYRCRNIHLIKTIPKKDTSIEIKVENILKNIGIKYQKQAAVQAIAVVDFFIPEKKLIIQCDGTYWHSLKHKIKNDTNQDFLFGFSGYDVLRLKENEINDHPKKCANKIIKALKSTIHN